MGWREDTAKKNAALLEERLYQAWKAGRRLRSCGHSYEAVAHIIGESRWVMLDDLEIDAFTNLLPTTFWAQFGKGWRGE